MKQPDDAALRALRDRFVSVARRRVPEDAAEDLVQSALQVVIERGWRPGMADRIDDLPPLAWCFQVLRHTIGNYYQRRRTADARLTPLGLTSREESIAEETPLEALEAREARRLVMAAIDSFAGDGTDCRHYLRRLLEGATPADLATEASLIESVLYRRVYRCREKLRGLLRERGILA